MKLFIFMLKHTIIKCQSYEGSRKQENYDNIVMICHGNVPEDAAYVEQLVREQGYKNVMISNAGPIIGTHTGASLVIIGFLGDVRS